MTTRVLQAPQALKDERLVKSEALFTQFKSRTPAQIENYVDANVNNLADVKAMLKFILKVLVMLARKTT